MERLGRGADNVKIQNSLIANFILALFFDPCYLYFGMIEDRYAAESGVLKGTRGGVKASVVLQGRHRYLVYRCQHL